MNYCITVALFNLNVTKFVSDASFADRNLV